MNSRWRRQLQLSLAIAMVALGIVVVPRSASAHVDLLGSCPSAGEVMSELLALRLSFNGPLLISDDEPIEVTLSRVGSTDQIALDLVEVVGVNGLRIKPFEALTAGEYLARYGVTSEDRDRDTGEIRFSFDPASALATNCGDPPDEDAGTGAGTQAALVVAPIVALGLGLYLLNRWADRRAEPERVDV